MNIIIAGAGKVGYTVAEQLDKEGHDLTLIDVDPAKLSRASNALEVMTYEGNSASLSILQTAGTERADVFIAATGSDEVNMVSCLMAKKLGVSHTMARIRNPEYMRDGESMKQILGLSMALNPDRIAADEISRILQFPLATQVETFPGTNQDVVTYRVPQNSKLVGVQLANIGKKEASKVLICAVEREDRVIIPNGDFIIQENDRITVVGARHRLRSFFDHIHAYKKPVRSVILLGGSRIAIYLALQLEKEGYDLTLVEKDHERCEYLADILRETDIMNGDGTRGAFLQEIGLDQTDAFVALTESDEENIILAMYANKCGVEKVVTKINEERFKEMIEDSSLDAVITPKFLIAYQIARYVRAIGNSEESSTIEALYYLAGGKVEAMEFVVGGGSKCVNIPLRELELRRGVLIASIIHHGKGHVPDGNSMILPGDKVIVVASDESVSDLDDILKD